MSAIIPTVALCVIFWATSCATARHPGNTALGEAVQRINDVARKSWAGRKQAPLTADEVLRVIQKQIRSDTLSKGDQETLERIERSRELPSHVRLRHVTRYDDGEKFNHVWWIRLVLENEYGAYRSFAIRKESLFSRPYTRMERAFKKEWSTGTPFLNRLSAYFKEDPLPGKELEIATEKAGELIASVQRALDTKDLDALLALQQWDGVTDSMRQFVRGELEELITSRVASLRVTPRRYGGKLHHWQGFRTYDTNLSHIGYLEVSFTGPTGSKKRHPLSLEVGIQDGQLRFLNYVESAFNPPEKLDRPSTRGHLDEQGDGVFLLWTSNERVGPIVSARLANEEVLRVRFEK